MKSSCIAAGILAALLMIAPSASAVTYNFSTDLGSDLDFSDPVSLTNNVMDCGDVYIEGSANNPPTLWKDDSADQGTSTGDADGDGKNTGHPFQLATQPLPEFVGNQANSNLVPEIYSAYFDLDAEDQTTFDLRQIDQQQLGQPVIIPKNTPGIYYQPDIIDLSFEDDGAPGWYLTGDVPTKAQPDNNVEVFRDTGLFWNGGAGQSWSPQDLTAQRTETQLGLAPEPGTMDVDDDVDALDNETHQFWYWSADHEANMNCDPGSIYVTDQLGAAVNQTKVIDDSDPTSTTTGLWLGILEDTDVDAFEFVAIGLDCYIQIFGSEIAGATPDDWILCGLFSVDADDPDTPANSVSDLYGDESGQLLDEGVYISNLLGQYQLMAAYYDDQGEAIGVDAISTVPEPSTAVLLCLATVSGMLVFLRRKK